MKVFSFRISSAPSFRYSAFDVSWQHKRYATGLCNSVPRRRSYNITNAAAVQTRKFLPSKLFSCTTVCKDVKSGSDLLWMATKSRSSVSRFKKTEYELSRGEDVTCVDRPAFLSFRCFCITTRSMRSATSPRTPGTTGPLGTSAGRRATTGLWPSRRRSL